MKTRIIVLAFTALALNACDVAQDQMAQQVRNSVMEQCRSVSESVGLSADLISPVCECTADTLMEKNASELSQIDPARIEEIVRSCSADAGVETGNGESQPAAETIGG